MIPSEIKTIKSTSEYIYKEKGSEFIANAFSISSAEDAVVNLKQIRKKFFDASHYCYAYRLFEGTFKMSDDGEPAGTAGLRILNALDHFQLTNTLVIVTRYFGGTKLGTGPLGKAYYKSAEGSLSLSEIIMLSAYIKVEIFSTFDYINQIHKVINDSDSRIIKTEYSDKVKFECLIKPEVLKSIISRIMDSTKGKTEIIETKNFYLI